MRQDHHAAGESIIICTPKANPPPFSPLGAICRSNSKYVMVPNLQPADGVYTVPADGTPGVFGVLNVLVHHEKAEKKRTTSLKYVD